MNVRIPPVPRRLLVVFLGVLNLPTIFLGIPSFPAAVFLLWAVLVYALVAASCRGE